MDFWSLVHRLHDATDISEEFHDLFEKKSFGHFATMMPDGTPQVTPVWVDYDAERGHVLVNTARGRRKERNVRGNPKVGIEIMDLGDAYRYVSVRGEVVEVTEEGTVDHIDELTQRYFEQDEYPNKGEERGPRVDRSDRTVARSHERLRSPSSPVRSEALRASCGTRS